MNVIILVIDERWIAMQNIRVTVNSKMIELHALKFTIFLLLVIISRRIMEYQRIMRADDIIALE
ncbi:MAG: hypothetical protein IPO83_01915 [Chitinophagaceae bacterium]|nr:hypothetical protein [Chitinophagaceae bacterium]